MRRSLRRYALAAAAVLVIAPAFASAPVDQYLAFNRSDLAITDAKTGLTWERFPTSEFWSFAQAATHCQMLVMNGRAWRVPTVKELLTIVDEVPHQELDLTGSVQTLAVDGRAFPDTPPGQYWSSSVVANSGSFAWSVDFVSGETRDEALTTGLSVRCVSP